MVKVFFENQNPSHADVVAIFASEEIYMACLPALEKLATESRCIVTESLFDSQAHESQQNSF